MKITRYYSKKTSKYFVCIEFSDGSVCFNNDVVAFLIDKYATICNVHPLSVRKSIIDGALTITVDLIG